MRRFLLMIENPVCVSVCVDVLQIYKWQKDHHEIQQDNYTVSIGANQAAAALCAYSYINMYNIKHTIKFKWEKSKVNLTSIIIVIGCQSAAHSYSHQPPTTHPHSLLQHCLSSKSFFSFCGDCGLLSCIIFALCDDNIHPPNYIWMFVCSFNILW